MKDIISEDLGVKPFLRWAGGKSWLTKHLQCLDSKNYNNYHEPFLGGGAAFFYLRPQQKSYLSDLNPDLINTYVAVRDNLEDVIDILKTFENTQEFYYKIRAAKFLNASENAAKFIYLNHTSFNGIYRVNLKGVYNVPYGFRNKSFLDESLLKKVNKILQNVELSVSDFDLVDKNIQSGDLVFLDPPYTVSHNNNGFIKYNEKLFSLEDQYRLSSLISDIKEKNAYYILTNAAHEKVKEIFANGDAIYEVSRQSLIGGAKAIRGRTAEYIFSNISFSSENLS